MSLVNKFISPQLPVVGLYRINHADPTKIISDWALCCVVDKVHCLGIEATTIYTVLYLSYDFFQSLYVWRIGFAHVQTVDTVFNG